MNTTISFITLERFIKIDKNTGCWNYNRPQKGRYPRIGYNGKKYPFHRISWILTNGEIPKGLYVCHRCDNTKCGNPDHLFLGTQFDNMQDMVSKGRNADTSGEHNGRANLTWEIVHNIRDDFSNGFQGRKLMKKYNLPEATISNVVRNKTWVDEKYVPPKVRPLNRAITKEIYDEVIRLRGLGLSQDKIEEKLGISQTSVWRVLSGNANVWSSE